MIRIVFSLFLLLASAFSASAVENNVICTEFFLSSEDNESVLDNIEVIFYTNLDEKNFAGDDPSYKLKCGDGLCARDEISDGKISEYRDYLMKSASFSSIKPIYITRSIVTEIDDGTKSIQRKEFNGQLICESELADTFVAPSLPPSINNLYERSTYSGYEISRINSCLIRLEKYADSSVNMFNNMNLPESFQIDFSKGYLFSSIPNFYEQKENFRTQSVTDEQQSDMVKLHLDTSNAWFDAMDCTRDLIQYRIMRSKKYR